MGNKYETTTSLGRRKFKRLISSDSGGFRSAALFCINRVLESIFITASRTTEGLRNHSKMNLRALESTLEKMEAERVVGDIVLQSES